MDKPLVELSPIQNTEIEGLSSSLTIGSRTKGVLFFLAKVSLSAGLIALLVNYLGTEALQRALKNADYFLLFVGCVACIGQVAMTSFKWKLILGEQGTNVRFTDLFEMQLTGLFVNIFAPSVLCGDAYRAAKLRHHTGSFSSAVPSVLADRFTGLAALLAIGVFGSAYVFAPHYLFEIVCCTLGLAIVAYLLLTGPLSHWLNRLGNRKGRGFFFLCAQVVNALKPSKTMLYVAFISLVFQLNVVWIVGLWAYAVGLTSASVWNLFIVVPAASIVEMIPFSLHGIGVREASYSLLFQKMGLASSEGLALGLIVSAMKYIAGLLAGLLVLLWPWVINPLFEKAPENQLAS